MASTYSALKIELIGTGEQSGTWGTTTNNNLGTAIEEAIVGRANANFTSDANLTISLTNTNASQVARNYILNVTSAVSLTATRNLIVPTINKPYIIENNTSGSQSIVVKTAAGTGVTVPNGKRMMVYANSTDVVTAFNFFEVSGVSISNATLSTPTITGGTIDNTPIGGTTKQSGAFTTLSSTGNTTLGDASGDTLTINGTAVTIPNGLNFDSNTFVVDATNNRVGVGSATPTVKFEVVSTDAVLLPVGTTGQRPTGAAGYIRYNTSLGKFEGYTTSWGSIGGGATGGGGDEIFFENGQSVTTNYTISAGKNAGTFGPVTVDAGATVTVPSGSVWTVV
jgi:hypothetical protein